MDFAINSLVIDVIIVFILFPSLEVLTMKVWKFIR